MTKVDRGLAALENHWCGGWDLLRATGRDSANAAARDCKAAALRRGFAWHTLDVNFTDDGPGHCHRLWCITRGRIPAPHHPAEDGGAVVVTELPPLAPEIERGIARTAEILAEFGPRPKREKQQLTLAEVGR